MLLRIIGGILAAVLFSGCATQMRHKPYAVSPKPKTQSKSREKTQAVYYTVQKGDSLWKIAKVYGISVKRICQINNFSPSRRLKTGEQILIPQNSSLHYQWPLKGEISFSHKGIDIKSKKSIIVYPFAEGEIDFARNINGYGYTVIIKHCNGLSSVYSNLAKIYVKEGTWIKQNQPVGKIGKNVRSGELFLYFELRKKGRAINPFLYLK